MVVNKEGKGYSYPHPIDNFNKKKAAGVVGYYKSVLPKNEKRGTRPSSAPPTRQNQSSVKNTPKNKVIPNKKDIPKKKQLRIQVDQKDFQTIVEEELGSSPSSSIASAGENRRTTMMKSTPNTASKYFNLADSADEGQIDLHPMY
ncbi:predicted protein [Naegleria gruberi]|uniref:Predicted protein n=1 Tax=Naegleria gruberi TaxID=5762 RepID=D2UZI2_NAEGR|nr:uncharacterized protein NAEGRDRAFT_61946 [Naegleria gruberi]EFC50156.1 predicted protein [Naegleria gruberi]|eukprot:XP_002682900.1 predicted protein [Naegleria gruberi strain NEG-M]